MKKVLLNPWLAMVTLSIMVMIRVWDPAFVESVRLRYFDQLITSRPAVAAPIHVVNIDEAALDRYGQFPFPRDQYAQIINDLYARDAGLVVFNVLMPEKDRFNKDSVLANTLERWPVILPSLGHTKSKNIDHGSAVQLVGQNPEDKLVEYPGLINSVESLTSRAAGIGVVNTLPEIDGVVRRMPLVIMSTQSTLVPLDQQQKNVYPALGLETLRVANNDRLQVKIGDLGVDAVRIPRLGIIPTDNFGRIWLDWSVVPTEHSLADLPRSFDKGIVIVGLSAAGLANPVATAQGEVWPHYVQAVVTATMAMQSNIKRQVWADSSEVIALAALGVILIFLMRWTYVGIAATLGAIGIVIGGSLFAYHNFLFLFDSTAIAVGLVLVALHAYIAKFVTEFLQKLQIKKQFSSYLSPDLVAKLIKDPSLLRLGGEEKELSIMFTDVRGFTSISEHYGRDVQGLTRIMNRYMTAMTKKILENHGTLDKYIGDAQMAFWNAPLDETKHCKDAVKAALEMLENLDEFNKEISSEGVPAFGMGIGINTGTVVVGNMGSEQRFDYTCLGDAVNLASRLEGQSKNYGVLIVLGPVTAERLGSDYFTLELDCIAVKGKTEGVVIYTVFYNPPQDTMSEWLHKKEIHELMLEYYRKQQWDKAAVLVDQLQGSFDGGMDTYYQLWLERIEDMRQAGLPSDWDGVFRATSK